MSLFLTENAAHRNRVITVVEPTFDSFSEYLRYHRNRLGYTQDELAEKSGISQSYVSGIERGINKDPEPEKLEGIARGIQRPVGEVFRVAGRALRVRSEIEYSQDDPDIPVIVEGYNGLTPQDKQIVKGVIERLRTDSRRQSIGGRNADEGESQTRKPEDGAERGG